MFAHDFKAGNLEIHHPASKATLPGQPVGGGFMTITNTGAEHGGHAFLLTGYSTQRRAWRLRNSWGTGWGDQGDAWLPWDYELWEAWWATPALVNGQCPLAALVAWLERMFPGLHIPL